MCVACRVCFIFGFSLVFYRAFRVCVCYISWRIVFLSSVESGAITSRVIMAKSSFKHEHPMGMRLVFFFCGLVVVFWKPICVSMCALTRILRIRREYIVLILCPGFGVLVVWQL